jgi:hypothetical protein
MDLNNGFFVNLGTGGGGINGHTGTIPIFTSAKTLGDSVITQPAVGYINVGAILSANQFYLPKNTPKGIAAIYNDSIGDIFGMEQVSYIQSGSVAQTRIFTSSQNNSAIGFGYYTSTSSFNYFAIFLNNGNFGVGTINPIYKFVVSNGGANGFEIDPTSASGTQTAIVNYDRQSSIYKPISFNASAFIFNNGNVLIGTSIDNGQKLQVNDSILLYNQSPTTTILDIRAYQSNNAIIAFGNYGAYGNTAKIIGNSGNATLDFYVNWASVDRLIISMNGYHNTFNVSNLPTSSSGLNSGDVYVSGSALRVA